MCIKVTKLHIVDVLTILIEWTMEGLDLEKAMAQPETTFKVRHLKMGIMMSSVLCTCDSYTSFRMLVGYPLMFTHHLPITVL